MADDTQGLDGPLDGYRVIDLTTVLMGPLASRVLADYGADVIRVESPAGGPIRNSVPARSDGMSHFTLGLQRNKRSIALNLKAPEGVAAALSLIESADILVTNLRPAALERLGLGPAELCRRFPRLIACVARGYGADGPDAAKAAYDDAIQAGSGLAWVAGEITGQPSYVPAVMADKVCGMHVAQAALAAVLWRQRTGQGQLVEVPMLETMVAFNLIEHLAGHAFEPPLGPVGYQRLMTSFRRPYATADGWICVLPYTDANWAAFLDHAGRSELLEAPEFANHIARINASEFVYGHLADMVAEQPTDHWIEFCDENSIPASRVLDLSRLDDDPHLAAVGMVEVLDHPTEGKYRSVREPIQYSSMPTGLRRHAPRLGEHTAELLAEIGYDDPTIADLIAREIATTP